LPEHGVDEGGFAVVDVGNDGDVANVLGHGACVRLKYWRSSSTGAQQCCAPTRWQVAQTKIAAGATSSPDESP
jgi:hypothetical protein